jgi:hypothetical protein
MVLIQPFPQPGRLVQLAYRELDLATSRKQDHLLPLRDLANVPRLWDLGHLRDAAAAKGGLVVVGGCRHLVESRVRLGCCRCHPFCWPQHPHVVHEIAVLADQRHRAGRAPTGEALEEWHRYSLPDFTERMRTRLRNHCQEIISRGRARAATPATSRKRVAAGGEIPMLLTFVPCSRNLITLSRRGLGLLILTEARSGSSSTA